MGTPNRRLGDRHDTAALHAAWMVPRKGLLRVKETDEDVRIVNVSATGAALLARAVDMLRPRDVVLLSFGGHRVRVSIARIVPTTDPSLCYYGVQFINPSPEMVGELLAHTTAGERSSLEEFWRRAQ